MSPDLLLRAWPGLLEGWIGPVVVTSGDWARDVTIARDGWILDLDGKWRSIASFVEEYGECIYLDLSRAECRDRVARHVIGPLARCSAESAAWSSVFVPALADLDPEDDTRCEDGSRLVDALALKLVADAVRP